MAYFCAEFGIDSSLPIYSGGLGVLAGDHIKAASDAATPMVAIGLLYRHGYFRQAIDGEGRQREEYPALDLESTSLRLEQATHGAPLVISVPLGERKVAVRVWRADVGRVPLYLLDTDIEENVVASDRDISQRLYSGDRDMRIRQEIVLGIGGVRALRALGYADLQTVHLNEGHAAFVLVELIAEAQRRGACLEQASAYVRKSAVFTTHTPVAAGHDRFDHSLLLYYLGPWWRDTLGFSDDELVSLGGDGSFSMTELALNLSRAANAVSAKHGEVTRLMFPTRSIGSITNGVHHVTWTGPRCAALYDRALAGWRDNAEQLRHVWRVAPDDLVAAHALAKRDLLSAIGAAHAGIPFQEQTLTIGFARRMAGYKRAALLFSDPERFSRIARMGLQLIFAGKAHPNDEGGKVIIEQIVRMARDRSWPVVFLEGYDMRLARLLIAGVDVWLNNPLRPFEASGTSGMKALLNGVPNFSVLDGWWVEGYSATNGWSIGDSDAAQNENAEDARDAASLYGVLEGSIVPEYYQNQEAWAARMRRAVATAPTFTSQRMVTQYASEVYA